MQEPWDEEHNSVESTSGTAALEPDATTDNVHRSQTALESEMPERAACDGGIEDGTVEGGPAEDERNNGDTDVSLRSAVDAGEIAEIAETLSRIDERIAESQRLLHRQSDLADKLHDENQRLRAGELRMAMLPLVRDLLRLHDDIEKLSGGRDDVQDLEIVKVSLIDTFARNGINIFQPDPGEMFDPRHHSVAGVLTTDDADRDRVVIDVSRVGVRWDDGSLIRVAEVRVYKHKPKAQDSIDSSAGSLVTNQTAENE